LFNNGKQCKKKVANGSCAFPNKLITKLNWLIWQKHSIHQSSKATKKVIFEDELSEACW
jgi:hypothetical protein